MTYYGGLDHSNHQLSISGWVVVRGQLDVLVKSFLYLLSEPEELKEVLQGFIRVLRFSWSRLEVVAISVLGHFTGLMISDHRYTRARVRH